MPQELGEMNGLLHSGSLAYGKWGKKFEELLGDFLGNRSILTTNSYNSAMLVLLSTLNLGPEDVVLASPMSCLASNQPFVTKGIKVKWVDIDPSTGTMDPDSLLKSIDKNTKAVFHNHHCGIPGHIDEINEIAKSNGLFVVDDCIEAFGSAYKGKILGNTGADAAIYSFQTVRLPNTIDGGALLFNNPTLLKKALQIRDYGIDRSTFRNEYNEISDQCDISLEGYGALMSEVNSYIGVNQMADVQELLNKQQKNGENWKTYFEEKYPEITLLGFRKEIKPNFWVFNFLTDHKMKMLKEFRDMGYYATGVHINNNIYSTFGEKVSLPGVNTFVNKHLAIPCGWWMPENHLENV